MMNADINFPCIACHEQVLGTFGYQTMRAHAARMYMSVYMYMDTDMMCECVWRGGVDVCVCVALQQARHLKRQTEIAVLP